MRRILVIDDSLTIRKLIGISLERAGLQVVLAATGNEGLAIAVRDVPDLIMLDFRLPDLTADDICARLLRDPVTAGVPLILMSAADDDVRTSMKSARNAIDFVPKPFNAAVVVARVQQALGRTQAPTPQRAPPPVTRPASLPVASPRPDRVTAKVVVAAAEPPAAPPPPPPTRSIPAWPFTQKEQLARVLYTKLKTKLAALPEAIAQLGDKPANPSGEIAKRLFTIDTIDILIEALQPLFEANARPASNVLGGSTSVLRLEALLQILADEGAEGEIRLQQDGLDTVLFLQAGLVVMVSTTSASRYMDGVSFDLAKVPADVLQRGTAEQTRTAKPLLLSLAEAGVTIADVATVVQHRGLRLLKAALEASGTYTFTPSSSLRGFASEFARPVTVEQLKLVEARLSIVEDSGNAAVAVWTRAPGFSRRVRRVGLDSTERKVGGAVDGRTTAPQIAAAVHESVATTVLALRRLQAVGLVDEVAAVASQKPLRVVVVGERPEFSEALRTVIAQHRMLGSYRVMSPAEVDGANDCDLMILGALAESEVVEVLGRVRPAFGGPIAVLCPADSAVSSQRLLDLGATAVLTKPVHVPTLCSLI
jgi:DNA-binding response OmpR family regulator